jgi:hypothetical protein
LAFWIEGEGYAPNAIGSIKPHLLHVGVPRFLEGIDMRPSKMRSGILEEAGHRQSLVLHVFRQREELRLKLVPDQYRPLHVYYTSKRIYRQGYILRETVRFPGFVLSVVAPDCGGRRSVTQT